jgi:hypothetical protein
MHRGRYQPVALSRREMLLRCANGFGSVALAALLGEAACGGEPPRAEGGPNAGAINTAGVTSEGTLAVSGKAPHFPAKAKSVIFLYMDGGPSQVDTFDPKPRLAREHGQPIQLEKVPATQFNNVGTVFQSPWQFRPRGECGMPISDLLPHVAECADDLAVIRSMVSNFSEHTGANYFLHTGNGQQGRPSLGSWVTYGLGSECHELPGFVVLDSGMIPRGGRDCFGSGFLPASYQATMFRHGKVQVADLANPHVTAEAQRRKMALVRELDQQTLDQLGASDQIESSIANYELAFRMQTAVPDLLDFSDETPATMDLYGVNEEPTRIFGQRCLLARRLVERGVRFIEVLCPQVKGDRWDQHNNLEEGHRNNALATDKPTAALLKDLKARGLLDETLVIWGGEFGRTPMAQGSDGRDHNPFGFSMWLAGGGIRGGTLYGATDDYGYFAIQDKVEIHDLHATMLHLLGMDHKRLTYRFGGRDMRLTDVHGHVIHDILA